ncbi:MAG: DUF4013 domain-containing protein [Bacteroidetes bacterium]|nr:DUF4013 domain-containing protein [Bacteroidota bacterium]
MNDLGKAFSSFFKDPRWFSKSAIASLWMLLCLVGIGIPVFVGYLVQVTQRVMRQETPVLPGWNGIGRKFVIGIKFCVAYIIYLLPMAILFIPVVGLAVIGAANGESETIPVIMSIYLFGVTLLMIPYGLALNLVTPILLFRFAERERISDAVDVVRVVRLFGDNWQNTLIVALISIGVQSLAPAGILIFLIGIFFTMFYAYVVSAHLGGLLYLAAQNPEPGT